MEDNKKGEEEKTVERELTASDWLQVRRDMDLAASRVCVQHQVCHCMDGQGLDPVWMDNEWIDTMLEVSQDNKEADSTPQTTTGEGKDKVQ